MANAASRGTPAAIPTTHAERPNADQPYLAPILEPEDPALQSIFAMLKANFGKVLTPAAVHSARLPVAFLQFYTKASELDRQLTLPTETAILVRQQVARVNVCEFCMDASRAATIMMGMDQAKFDALGEFRTSPAFTDRERAMLEYVTELTAQRKVRPETFARLAERFNEREICEIVYLVASEHLNNLTNLGLNIHSDMICDVARGHRR